LRLPLKDRLEDTARQKNNPFYLEDAGISLPPRQQALVIMKTLPDLLACLVYY
jgi:hypothetical protein